MNACVVTQKRHAPKAVTVDRGDVRPGTVRTQEHEALALAEMVVLLQPIDPDHYADGIVHRPNHNSDPQLLARRAARAVAGDNIFRPDRARRACRAVSDDDVDVVAILRQFAIM